MAASTGTASSIRGYGAIFARELGLIALILAIVGLLVSLRRRRTPATYPLLITFGVNLVGAAAAVGAGGASGFNTVFLEEGFLYGCYFVLACWLALGATELVESIGKLSIVGRFGLDRRREHVKALVVAALGCALLVPSVVGHWSVVRRSDKPFADSFAESVFSELPPRSVLLMYSAERTQPLIYRQVVDHQRRDVVVIAADGLTYGWYREQLRRRLGLPLPPADSNTALAMRRLAKSLRGVRPLYVDTFTGQMLANQIPSLHVPGGDLVGYQPVGLLAKVTGGTGPAPVSSPSSLDRTVRQAERAAGMPDSNWLAWPNTYVFESVYLSAGLEVARAYFEAHDNAGMRSALLNQLRIDPQDAVAQQDLQKLDNSSG